MLCEILLKWSVVNEEYRGANNYGDGMHYKADEFMMVLMQRRGENSWLVRVSASLVLCL